jgi:hypothetical protein
MASDSKPPSACNALYVLALSSRSTNQSHASALRNAQELPLLRLPAETRNEIYAYVLTESPDARYTFNHFVIRETSAGGRAGTLSDAREQPLRLALLATCRQIHTETQALPFTVNRLCFRQLTILAITIVRLLPHQRTTITHGKILDSLCGTADDFVRTMARQGHQELRSILPSVRGVAIHSRS